MRNTRNSWISALTLLAAVVLAGCGDDAETAAESPEETPTNQSASPEEAEEPNAAAGAEVTTAETDLGTILVDGAGMTLYLFTNDSPGTSVCEGDCLVAWPPLEGEATAGEGVDESLLGTITRSDGSTQASYGDWPLYYWVEDEQPGDVTGQGVGGVWYVIDAEGNAIETPAGG